MTRPIASESPRILLVEGQDDKHVVLQLHMRHQHHQAIPDFCISDKDGLPKLLESIGPEIKVSGRQVVGILVDANDDMEARWQELTNRLRSVNIQPPGLPNPAGTIIEVQPRIGIWLMPDNRLAGELEDFVVRMIPDEDQVWSLSQRYIEKIPQADRKFSEKKKLRAQLHAWLATRKDPRKMGLAIRAGDLKINGNLSQKFVVWLTELFK